MYGNRFVQTVHFKETNCFVEMIQPSLRYDVFSHPVVPDICKYCVKHITVYCDVTFY